MTIFFEVFKKRNFITQKFHLGPFGEVALIFFSIETRELELLHRNKLRYFLVTNMFKVTEITFEDCLLKNLQMGKFCFQISQ